MQRRLPPFVLRSRERAASPCSQCFIKCIIVMAGRVCGGHPAGPVGAAGAGGAEDLPLRDAPDQLAGLPVEHPPPWHPQVSRPYMRRFAAMTRCRSTARAREHKHDCAHDQMGGRAPCRSRCALQISISKERNIGTQPAARAEEVHRFEFSPTAFSAIAHYADAA